MKSKIILTALALMLLTISAASAWQMSTIGVGHNPSVYSNLVAWSDDTSGNGGNIHVYDLSAKKDTVINTSSAFYPAIYGNKLVWNDQGSQIAVYDLKSKNGSYISQNADTSSVPKIYGNVVVWSANDAVHMYDLSKSNETEIGTGTNPNIDGTKISYTDDSFSGFSESFPGLGLASTIKVYDISKGTTRSCGSGDNSHISGNKVVWLNSDSTSGMTSGQSNLVLFDLSNNKTTNVTSGSTSVGSFDIYGDNIVYVNQSGSSDMGDFSDITDIIGNIGSTGSTGSTGGVPCIYSISKGKVTEMANETQAGNIDVYGNTIVWDTPASGSNITVYQAASSSSSASSTSSSSKVTKPVAAFTANKVSGTHPLTVTFTYKGTGGTPDSYTWNFNDKTSTVTTTSKTVTHTFKNKGTFTVCCTAKNKAGSNTATKSKYITAK